MYKLLPILLFAVWLRYSHVLVTECRKRLILRTFVGLITRGGSNPSPATLNKTLSF